MTKEFSGKNVIVTGAGGGQGLAIARALQEEGAEVTAIDVKPEPDDFNLASGHYVEGDITDEAFVKATIATAHARAGRLDYLVNAAGVGWFDTDTSIVEKDMALWRRVIEINLTGAGVMARHAVPLIKQGGRGGALVHIASIAGLRNMENIIEGGPMEAYQASKFALVGLSRSLAMQFALDNIRSNTICPGAILSPMTSPIYDTYPERAEAMAARTPLRRLGLPEDIAFACLFLLSDRASFITGIDLVVDGGLMAQL